MNMMKLLIVINFIFAVALNASFDSGIMESARPVSMGGAFIGIADDVSAVSINSSGIAQLNDIELSAGYSLLYAGLDYSSVSRFFFSGTYPFVKILSLGFYFNRLSVDNYSENTVLFSFSRGFFGRFYIGMNYKFFLWDALPAKLYDTGAVEEDLSGSGFSFDLTGLIKLKNGVNIGFVLADINTPDIASSESAVPEYVPFSFKIGAGYKLNNWNLAGDLIFRNFKFSPDNPNNNEIEKKVGAEYFISDYKIYCRSGVSFYNIFKGFNWSFGAGYIIKISDSDVKIDYAFVMPFLSVKSTYATHYLTVGYKF